uniref:Uncharacterized protein n=1 Tax=Wuchereria bancrofti TaxID=6293 RepID=A0AAF5PPN1_WUCBA
MLTNTCIFVGFLQFVCITRNISVQRGVIDRIQHCKEEILYYNEYYYIALQVCMTLSIHFLHYISFILKDRMNMLSNSFHSV